MDSETRRTLGERLNERMQSRHARRRPTAQVSSFYDRFGLVDPLDLVPGQDAPSNAAFVSGASLFALLKRLGEAEARRERRMGRLFGRDGYTPFRRMGDKPRGLAPFAMGAFGSGDFLLIRPSTQAPPVVDVLAEQPVARTPTRKPKLGRQPKVRTTRAVRHALSAPAAPKPDRRGPKMLSMDVRLPHVPGAAPRVDLDSGTVRSARPATTRRAERRESSEAAKAEKVALPMLRTLERLAREVPEREQAAALRQLAGDLRQTSPRQWTAQVRAAIREIDAGDLDLSADLESSLPDAYQRPMSLAMSRAGSEPSRGLKPVTRSSPLVRAALAPASADVTAHTRRARALASAVRKTRAPRRIRRASPAVRLSASRAGAPSRASSGASASDGGSDGPEPGPAPAPRAVKDGLRRALAAAREAAVLQDIHDDAEESVFADRAERAERQESPALRGARRIATARRAMAPASVSALRRAEPGLSSGSRWQTAVSSAPARSRRPSSRRVTRPAGARPQAAAPSLLSRLNLRDALPEQMGLPKAFFQRFGMAPAPVRGAAPVEPAQTDAPQTRLERLGAARVRRDERDQAFEARHAEPVMEAARRMWPGERVARPGMPTMAPTDLLLPKADLAATDAGAAPAGAEAASAFYRAPKVASKVGSKAGSRRSPALSASRLSRIAPTSTSSARMVPGRAAQTPTSVASLRRQAPTRAASADRSVQGFEGGEEWVELEAALEQLREQRQAPARADRRSAASASAPAATASEASSRAARPGAAAEAPARATARRARVVSQVRPMDRAGDRLSAGAAPDAVVRALEDAAVSAASARSVATVVEAIEALAVSGGDERSRGRIVREAIAALGPVGRVVAAQVEAALPDLAVRPSAVAAGRVQEAGGKAPRGLRTLRATSPMMQEILPAAPAPVSTEPASAAPAASKPRSRVGASVSASSRSAPAPRQARLSASPVARAPKGGARSVINSPTANLRRGSSAVVAPPVESASRPAVARTARPDLAESPVRRREGAIELGSAAVAAALVGAGTLPEAASSEQSASVRRAEVSRISGVSAPDSSTRPTARVAARLAPAAASPASTAPSGAPTVAASGAAPARARRGSAAILGVAGRFMPARAERRSMSTDDLATQLVDAIQDLPASSHAVARMDSEPGARSSLPRVAPQLRESAVPVRTRSNVGAFSADLRLVQPAAETVDAVAESTASKRAPEPRVGASRPTREAPAARTTREARAARPEQIRATPRGAYVPVRLLEAMAEESGSSVARISAVVAAVSRGELAPEQARSLLPRVAPRLDALFELGGVRAARAPQVERVLSVSEGRAAEVEGAEVGATPRSAAAQAGLRARTDRRSRPAPVRGASARAESAPTVGYLASNTRFFADAASGAAPRAALSAGGRAARRSRSPLAYASSDYVLASSAAVQAADGQIAQTGAPGAARVASRVAGRPGRSLDRVGARVAGPTGDGERGRLNAPVPASAGAMRLLSEARAVQEVLSALSRGPGLKNSRGRQVSSSARTLLREVMADVAAPGADANVTRVSRVALTEAYNLLSGLTPSAEAEPTTGASRGPRATRDSANLGRTRRNARGAPELRLPSAGAAANEGEGATTVGAPRASRAGERLRSRVAVIRGLVGASDVVTLAGGANRTENAETSGESPRPAGRAAARSRVPRRERLSRRSRVAESLLFAGPGASGPGSSAAGPGSSAPGAGGVRRAGLDLTLARVEDGETGQDLPGWATRSVGQTNVKGTVSGLLDAFAVARGSGDVLRALNRQDASLKSARTLPAPVLRLIDEIRAEAAADAQREASEMASAMGLPQAIAPQRRSPRGSAPTAQVLRGFNNLSRTERTQGQQGLGADRLMSLVRRLQQLVFLADSQKSEALRQVRLAEDNAAARAEGQAAATQSGDSQSHQVDVDALAQEVTAAVQKELEHMSSRQPEDPGNRSLRF